MQDPIPYAEQAETHRHAPPASAWSWQRVGLGVAIFAGALLFLTPVLGQSFQPRRIIQHSPSYVNNASQPPHTDSYATVAQHSLDHPKQTASRSDTVIPATSIALADMILAEDTRPTLPTTVTAYFAPDPTSPPAAVLLPATRYSPVARAGWTWVQINGDTFGPVWVATADLANPVLNLAVLPNLTPPPPIVFPPGMVQPNETAPRTPAPVAAQFAPGTEQAVVRTIPAGEPYELHGRNQHAWVQADVAGYGSYWIATTALGLGETDLSTLPNYADVLGYAFYRVQAGDTLAGIALAGGSDATAIAQLNRIADPLVVGRPLIIPILAGGFNTLPSYAELIKWGNREQPYVALTVDVEYGDVSYLLNVLRQHGVQATMFVTAGWAKSNPDHLRQMVADGHELGNHSATHRDFRFLSAEEMAWELAETERIVHEITGSTTRPYFRPPYGEYTPAVLQLAASQGYLTLFWGIDTQDALRPPKSPEFVYNRMVNTFAREQMPGVITLSHCCAAHLPLPDALPAIISTYQAMGLELRPLSAVLGE